MTTPTSKAWLDEIEHWANELNPKWIELRRYLHKHPELSDHEFATTSKLNEEFLGLGLPVNVVAERRGLTCDLISDPDFDGSLLALRGDIDALPIQDEKTVGYRSINDQVMHACGHDVHAAIIYAAMSILRKMQSTGVLPWPVAVRALLQPSEEKGTGAMYMVHRHALERVATALALHVDPTRSVGSIGLRSGLLTAHCDMFQVECRGIGGHGARPHLTTDPVEAISQWIQSAYRRLSRVVAPIDAVTMSIGKLRAGEKANVIPSSAVLEGTLRTLSVEVRKRVLGMLESISDAVAMETGCKVEFRLLVQTPAVINDPDLVVLLEKATKYALGAQAVQWIDEPSLGSEDFSIYLKEIPGAMLRLGVAGQQVGTAPLHTSLFDVDESAIMHGAKVMATAAILYFQPPGNGNTHDQA